MKRKILILNSSPRTKGNTEELADAFLQGAMDSGKEVKKINLRQLTINPCKGCYMCYKKKGSPCIQQDDMQKIYDAFDECNTVVLASPVYFWTFNGIMKNVIDRLLAAGAVRGGMPKKDCILMAAAGDDDESVFNQIVSYYKEVMVERLSWNDKGMILAGGVNEVGDILKTPFLSRAQNMAASL